MQYAGDITSLQAMELLSSGSSTLLVDVRNAGEIAVNGAPDISKSQYVICTIYEAGSIELSSNFISSLLAMPRDAELLFLCRSGARSQQAAIIATQMGYKAFNVTDGFEGPPDEKGNRGLIAGWKASHLPWSSQI
jgi:rhodanese-related sulfurtransferase